MWATLPQALEDMNNELQDPRMRKLKRWLVACTLPQSTRFLQDQRDICLVCDLSTPQFPFSAQPGGEAMARHGLLVGKTDVTRYYDYLCSLAHTRFCNNPTHHDRIEACLLDKGHEFVMEPAVIRMNVPDTDTTTTSSSTPSS